MAELPDVKAVLNTIYTPKLTLNKFVVKALGDFPKLQLKDIQAYVRRLRPAAGCWLAAGGWLLLLEGDFHDRRDFKVRCLQINR
jgi:hypothetical protein